MPVADSAAGFFMSMDGQYSARSQEGGAVMSMDGQYSARSQEGGAVMSMDGRKIAPAFSALPPSLVVVFRKEPGMAVRLCPWWLNTRILAGDGRCWVQPIHGSIINRAAMREQ